MPDLKARILLWGMPGSGRSTTLRTIHEKLRPDLRGEIQFEPTRLDPTVVSETLLINLGQAGGLDNQIELIAVPGAPDQAMSRKQLLDGVDGLILLFDASPERIEENIHSVQELRASLAAYGRRLEDVPAVLQYNKRDIADPFAIEDLHRRIGLSQAAVFETIATTGHGILSALTTISKHVVRARRGQSGEQPSANAGAAHPSAQPTPQPRAPMQATPAPPTHESLEAAILAEEGSADFAATLDWQAELDEAEVFEQKNEVPPGGALQIVSVGQARLSMDQSVELPLVLGDEGGQTRSVLLTLRLDALPESGRD